MTMLQILYSRKKDPVFKRTATLHLKNAVQTYFHNAPEGSKEMPSVLFQIKWEHLWS